MRLLVDVAVGVDTVAYFRQVVKEAYLVRDAAVRQRLRNGADRRRDDLEAARHDAREDDHAAGPHERPRSRPEQRRVPRR